MQQDLCEIPLVFLRSSSQPSQLHGFGSETNPTGSAESRSSSAFCRNAKPLNQFWEQCGHSYTVQHKAYISESCQTWPGLTFSASAVRTEKTELCVGQNQNNEDGGGKRYTVEVG